MNQHVGSLAAAVPYDAVFDAKGVDRAVPVSGRPKEVVKGGVWDRLGAQQRLVRMREMLAEGATVNDMAVALQASPRAVRSAAFRAGLCVATVVRRRVGPPMAPAEDVRPDAWVPLAGSTPVTLADNEGCSWPVGEGDGRHQLFCGCSVEGEGSYCETHAKMARGS